MWIYSNLKLDAYSWILKWPILLKFYIAPLTLNYISAWPACIIDPQTWIIFEECHLYILNPGTAHLHRLACYDMKQICMHTYIKRKCIWKYRNIYKDDILDGSIIMTFILRTYLHKYLQGNIHWCTHRVKHKLMRIPLGNDLI